jgi:hypothetical protein
MRLMRCSLRAVVVIAGAPALALAQTGTVIGRVVDSASQAPRSGAIAAIVGTAQSARTGADGRFILARVAAGERSIRVQSLGFAVATRTIVVRENDTTRVEIAIAREAVVLDLVRADAAAEERRIFETTPNVGSVSVTARAIASVPRLGEADLVRVVQLLPGVQAKNDFSTGFNARGGESDQNLILIDDYPIYNPFHLGGLFSTFIAPTVRDVRLLTGAFPARYGGRLSSVLDVRSMEEPRPGIHGAAEISVLASTATIGGAFDDGKGSWTLAGRRTYADKLIQAVSDERLPYHFRDEQAHMAYALPAGLRLSASLYDGRDVLDGSFAQVHDSTGQGAAGGAFFLSWGNLVAGATLAKTLNTPRFYGDSAVVEQRVSSSRFSTVLDLGSGTASFVNSIEDVRVGGAFSTFSRRHDRSFGYDVTAYRLGTTTETGQGSASTAHTRQRPTTVAAYYDDLWRASPSLLISGGLRVEAMNERRWSALSPRISAKYLTSKTSAFTAAAGLFSQALHSLTLEDNPVRLFDVWRSAGAGAPVSTAWQFVAGHERWLGASRFMRIESFYKRYHRLLEFNLGEDTRVDGDEFVDSDGTSYGADVLLRQLEVGRFGGWLAYTYTMNSRVNDGVRYTPAHDRRHDLNVVGTWRFTRFVTGARLGYASGLPYTDIIGWLPRRRWDPVLNAWGAGGARVFYDDIGDTRNGARLPATRRLDLFVERSFQWRGATITPNASVVNASNAHNVLFYVYDYQTAPGTRRTVSQFPILPSVGVSIAF